MKLVIALLIVCGSVWAQAPDVLWTRAYGGTQYDEARTVFESADGGYLLSGYTRSFGNGGNDVHSVRTDESGNILWTSTFGGIRWEEANVARETADGAIVLAGYTYSYGSTGANMLLVKLSSSGELAWYRTYGGSSDQDARGMQVTLDDGFVLAGYTGYYGQPTADIYVIKADSNGIVQWNRSYGTSRNDEAWDVRQTSDGGYVVAGRTRMPGVGGYDLIMIRLDSAGTELWRRTFGGAQDDVALCIQQTRDGGFVLAGHTLSFGLGAGDFYLVKTDSLGDTLWTRTYGGNQDDCARSVLQTSDCGYVVAGYTFSFGAVSGDFYLVRTNSVGDTLWTRKYGGSGTESAYALQQTFDGGYVVAGNTQSYGAGIADFWLVKTGPDFILPVSLLSLDAKAEDESVVLSWVTGSESEMSHFEIERDGAVVANVQATNRATGNSYQWRDEALENGREYFYTLTSVDLDGSREQVGQVSATPRANEVPSEFVLLQNYPNPFNASTTIEFVLPEVSDITLTLHNLLGEEVATLSSGVMSAGVHRVNFDAGELSSGIYFYRLQAGEKMMQKKMAVVK